MNTRNNNKSVVIPKVRTEAGRKTFSFQGAKVFNNLPNNLQTETSLHGGGGSSIVKVPGDVPPARVYFFGLLVIFHSFLLI